MYLSIQNLRHHQAYVFLGKTGFLIVYAICLIALLVIPNNMYQCLFPAGMFYIGGLDGMVKESKTTTVGLVVGDHVVLAADKRATAGSFIAHKRVKKIQLITNYAALTISGLVADAQFLVEQARYIARKYYNDTGSQMKISALASNMSLILTAYLRVYPFIVQLLLGGVDSTGPQLYYLDLYGTISREEYMATGSGSPTAIGVLEEGYSRDLTVDDAVELAKKAVLAAMRRDGFSGEGVDVVVIGREGVREYTFIREKKLVFQQ